MKYLGLTRVDEAGKEFYYGRIGELEDSLVFISYPPTALPKTTPIWGLAVVRNAPTTARAMLSAIAVLERVLDGSETPIASLHNVPLRPNFFGVFPSNDDVKKKFTEHGWEITTYNSDDPLNPRFEAAIFPRRPRSRILFEIPPTQRVSRLQLRFYDGDGSVADLRYFKNLVAEMFGKPD